MLRSNKFAAGIGALVGFGFTRLPYMEDGNLLITTVVVLITAAFTLLLWLSFKKIIS